MLGEPPKGEAAPDLGGMLKPGETPGPMDETVARLERDLEGLRSKLHEERFLWILACIVLLDAYIFTSMDNIAGPIVIGVLQLVAVVILADRCGVDTVAPLIDRLTGFARKATKIDGG